MQRLLRPVPRALLAVASVGSLAAAASVALAFARQPSFTLDMDRDLPAIVSGFYPVERNREATFAWTTDNARVTLPGADRRWPWECVVTIRGGRAAPVAQPVVEVGIDGVMLGSRTATNDFVNLLVRTPARPSRTGLELSIAVSPTFEPGTSDPRKLGVQVDRLACGPMGGGLVLPPRGALVGGAVAGAAVGAALALAGFGVWPALAATLLVVAALAVPLASGAAPYTGYPARVAWLAAWIAASMVLSVAGLQRWRRKPLRPAARFVIAFSALALLVELLLLLHPAKPIVDALFQAHRLEWVLGGRYYFTQPMPDGVRFPYAIALYLFAAPWSVLTSDYVSLLRIVVCVCRAVAGALLYPMVTRTWGDQRAGALAVVLIHLVPLPFLNIGNGNLTFVFGQSAALATLAAAVALRLEARDVSTVAGLTALTALALLSHVGIFAVLLLTLVAVAGLYRGLGGVEMRAPSRAVVIAATLAAAFSVLAYYGHFGEAYQTLERVRARAVALVAAAPASQAAAAAVSLRPPPTAAASREAGSLPLPMRVLDGLARGVRAAGWPVALLALAGLWRTWIGGARNRMGLALAAVGIAYLALLIPAVAVPVEPRFQRYTDEFIDRLSYATLPAVVLLAARGSSWAWTSGVVLRIVSVLLLLAAVAIAVQQGATWIQ